MMNSGSTPASAHSNRASLVCNQSSASGPFNASPSTARNNARAPLASSLTAALLRRFDPPVKTPEATALAVLLAVGHILRHAAAAPDPALLVNEAKRLALAYLEAARDAPHTPRGPSERPRKTNG
ncbi:MAG: hypothetical protein V2I27_13735 [Erythrobacter sp.]|jgi:hypothetical protein|nr:hypothetical protein [Erythrobacter sp.]